MNIQHVFASSVLFLIALQLQAQSFVGAEAAGTGGAGRAITLPNSSHFLNPASIVNLPPFTGAATYMHDENQRRGRGENWVAQFADASPEALFAGSVSAQLRSRDIPNYSASKSQDYQIDLAQTVYPGVSVGIAGHRLIEKPNVQGQVVQDNFNAGVMYNPLDNLGFAVVAYDVLTPNPDIPDPIRLSRIYAMGLSYVFFSNVRMRFDVLRQEEQNPDHRLAFMGGIENYILHSLCVRVGYGQDDRIDQKLYTAGLGWEGPKLRANYAFQMEDGQGGYRHLIDLWLTF